MSLSEREIKSNNKLVIDTVILSASSPESSSKSGRSRLWQEGLGKPKCASRRCRIDKSSTEGRRSFGERHKSVNKDSPEARFHNNMSPALANNDVRFQTYHRSLLLLILHLIESTIYMLLETSDRQTGWFQSCRVYRTNAFCYLIIYNELALDHIQ